MNFPLILKRPLIFFDLETTGLDFKYDRIIEIGAVKIFPDGKRETFIKRVNPQMRVPAEITALTGISDEEASKEPTLSDIMPELSKFFEDSDLAGYHIGRFDAKVMVEEFRRAGADFKLDDRAIVDSQIIFHQKEKRDLSAAYKFYCQKELNNAHSAKADTEATLEILVSQIERYTDLPRDVQALDQYCRGQQGRFVDAEGKFFWRDGEAVFNFGKFKSQSLQNVLKSHPEYLHWIISPDQHFSQEVVDICYRAMKGQFPVKLQSTETEK